MPEVEALVGWLTETVRTLDALQTDELCPCNWTKGEETLTQKMAKAG